MKNQSLPRQKTHFYKSTEIDHKIRNISNDPSFSINPDNRSMSDVSDNNIE